MGKNIVHCGDVGTGGMLKLQPILSVSNLIIFIYRLCACCRCGKAVQQLVAGHLYDRHLRGHEPGKSRLFTAQLAHLFSVNENDILYAYYYHVQGVKLGMDASKLAGVLNTSTGR